MRGSFFHFFTDCRQKTEQQSRIDFSVEQETTEC